MNTSQHNPFDTCFVTRVFVLIINDDTVKVLSTFKHLRRYVGWSKALDYHLNGAKCRWFKSGWKHILQIVLFSSVPIFVKLRKRPFRQYVNSSFQDCQNFIFYCKNKFLVHLINLIIVWL